MKKILFIITQSEYGGAQRFIFNIATHIEPSEFDITVAFGERGKGDFLEHELKKRGIKTHRFKHLKRNFNIYQDLRSLFEIRSYIINNGFSTVFLNSSKAGFNGSLACIFPSHLKNVKIIYRIGGWAFNDPRPKWQKSLLIFLERLSARWKDLIILNNKKDLQDAQKLNIKPRKGLKLIYNGINVYKTNFLSKEKARLELFKLLEGKKINLFQKKIIVGTVANFYPSKGLFTLLECAKRFSNDNEVAFVLIGDGMLRAKIEDYIKLNRLRNVILAGQIANTTKYLKAFDIFVMSSIKEGFPWAVLEAMAARVPVIAAAVGALPEIIEDGKNGFLTEPKRPQQIAAKIEKLIKNEHLRQEFGIQGHQTVLFKFPLDKMVGEVKLAL